ncbi:MAG TPA: energy transducer TonB [Campylobacterales bacterium]|nr:energy transducer TonB [Campylobacterales bacterium]
MNRSSFAFFVSLLLHIVILLLLWILWNFIPDTKPQTLHKEKKIKISLKEMPKKEQKSGLTKQKTEPIPIVPPMPKGSQLKKIVKQKTVKYKPKKIPKKTKLNKPSPVKKIMKKTVTKQKIKPLPTKKSYIPLEKKSKKPKKKQNKLSWLYEDKSDEEVKNAKKKTIQNSSNISQNIKKLYGDTFGKLTPGQQQYILDNQEIMRRITQQVLNRVARVNIPRDLHVNRSNVVEFYLHPNGDISGFRFLTKSGYYILDETTKETIEYAYSRYPRPKETTLIRYNVYYRLADY